MNAPRRVEPAEIERHLRAVPVVVLDAERNAELRAKLLADIPAELPALPAPPPPSPTGLARVLRFRGMGFSSGEGATESSPWRLAAALAVMVIGGGVAWQLVQQDVTPQPSTVRELQLTPSRTEVGAATNPPTADSKSNNKLESPRPSTARVTGAAGTANRDERELARASRTVEDTAAVSPVQEVDASSTRALAGGAEGKLWVGTEQELDVVLGVVSREVGGKGAQSSDGYTSAEATSAVLPAPPPPPPPPTAPRSVPRPPAKLETALESRDASGGKRLPSEASAVPQSAGQPSALAVGRLSEDRDGVGDAPEEARERMAEKQKVVPGNQPPAAAPSTGGSSEPNDQAFGDMFFRPSDANPFVDTSEDARSTFGLDVDTGSYNLLRGYLDRGSLPPREAVRIEEVVNAFDYRDPAPTGRDLDFALYVDGAPSPFAAPGGNSVAGERYRLVRFALRARDLRPADRKPVVLTFVVDVSGSMQREDRLGLVKHSLHLLIDQLRGDDRVGLVVYGSAARVVLPHTVDRERLRSAVDSLVPEGATNAEAGLVLAYDLAGSVFRDGAVNRLILCSDGVANVGQTGPESILQRIGSEARRGIELTTVGFGMGNYNDVLMEQLANQGNGRYAYIDSLAEARRLFVEQLAGTLVSLAGDAKAQVVFDPNLVERWRLLGYENRDIADERFRDDSVDAGEIGYGHTVTALYEIKLRDSVRTATGWLGRPAGEIATLHLRYRQLASGKVIELARPLSLGALAPRFDDASPALRLAAAAAEWAELLRGSYWARGSSFAAVSRELARLPAGWVDDPRARELVGLVALADRLAPPARGGRRGGDVEGAE